MLFQDITPFFEHFAATGAALLVLVPEFAQETIRRAVPQREIDASPFIIRFVAHTLYTDRVALGQGFEWKIFLEEDFCLILGSVVAVGEYIEEVAVIDITLPVTHEVPEKAQLLPEKPTIAHVVLESLHLGFLLFLFHRLLAISAPKQNRAENKGFQPTRRSDFHQLFNFLPLKSVETFATSSDSCDRYTAH